MMAWRSAIIASVGLRKGRGPLLNHTTEQIIQCHDTLLRYSTLVRPSLRSPQLSIAIFSAINGIISSRFSAIA